MEEAKKRKRDREETQWQASKQSYIAKVARALTGMFLMSRGCYLVSLLTSSRNLQLVATPLSAKPLFDFETLTLPKIKQAQQHMTYEKDKKLLLLYKRKKASLVSWHPFSFFSSCQRIKASPIFTLVQSLAQLLSLFVCSLCHDDPY